MTHDDSFATRIIKCRSARGWSQADLSKASGVAPAQISRYEQGDVEPRPVALAKLSAALNVSFSYLALGYEEKIEEDAVEEDRYTRITLRIPKELHEKLAATAAESSKSMNAEIVARLSSTLASENSITTDFIADSEEHTIRIEAAVKKLVAEILNTQAQIHVQPHPFTGPRTSGPALTPDGKPIMGNSDETESKFDALIAAQNARTNKKTG
jgi:transcriptional regulator with XRE-family HTH domain